MPAIVILGEQGTGKSRHGKRVAEHYGKTRVVEYDCLEYATKGLPSVTDSMLILTNSKEMAEQLKQRYGARIVDIADAKAAITANR